MEKNIKNDDRNKEIDFVQISFQIITHSGVAKSKATEAIMKAKTSDFEEAHTLIKDAEFELAEAAKQHGDVIFQEARDVKHPFSVLFMHAEDQMMTTQIVVQMANEFIDVYKELRNGK
ncbi:PTS lactose/cellobiose transporter subunit IIA [Spiroplasma endosymbiont of Anurida maritima]|uniref:PTS lactose/cellobiose transporter subunit IIA n=1 Tax=Spiroplasma endosymbiont of Anurida maritima TaxID=2967972 RepID=UPI0036D2DBAE